jgi:transposase-like protein
LEGPQTGRRRAAQGLPRADAEAGRKALEAFEEGAWGRKYAAINQIWRRQWEQIVPFFAFAPPVRKNTTNEA